MNKVEIICLEKILAKLTSVIQMYEFEEANKLIKLCDCANSVSAQLDYLRNHYEEMEDDK